MSAPWVAGDVRAIGLSHRILGAVGAQSVSSCNSLAEALALLTASPYARDITPGQTLTAAQHAVAATLLWNIRVLAGWSPSAGVSMLRVLVGWYEIANVEARLRISDSADDRPLFDLGGLATSWNRLAGAEGARDLCDRLETTAWGRPDDESRRTIGLAMRVRLLDRATVSVPACRSWAAGAAALILARERLMAGAELPPQVRRTLNSLLGAAPVEVGSLGELRDRLSSTAGWVLDGFSTVEELWRAEGRWWSRLEADGFSLLRHSSFGPQQVVGAVAVMAADAWRVRGALELAAHHGRGRGELDALA